MKCGCTAIDVFEDYGSVFVVAACGDTLKLFDDKQNVLCVTKAPFEGIIFHGFARYSLTHMCFGNRYCFLWSVDEKTRKIQVSKSFMVSDWILDVLFVDSDVALLALAHNSLVKLSLVSGKVLEKHACAPPLLLYSAKIILDHDQHQQPLVLAGTMDNKIILWEGNNGSIRATLSGHVGVAYGVDACFVGGKLVVGCAADDRSVRIWKDEQCTAFWGHQSRPWQLKFFENGNFVCSGEDGTLRWGNIGENDKFCCVKQVSHGDVRRISVLGGLVACGCDDGSISLWNSDQVLKKHSVTSMECLKNARVLHLTDEKKLFMAVDCRVFLQGDEVYKPQETKSPIIFLSELSGKLITCHKGMSFLKVVENQ